MAQDKRRFKAVIGDRTYTIVGPGSVAQFETVTALLNQELAALLEQAPQMSREDAAILLAFNAMATAVKTKADLQLDDSQE